MNHTHSRFLLSVIVVCAIYCESIHAITLVYNMKIRRAFDLSTSLGESSKPLWIATVLPIIYKRDRHIVNETLQLDVCEKRLSGGALLNLRFIPERAWWLELSTGIEKEHVESHGSVGLKASRAGFDDVLLTAGHNFFLSDRMQFVIYGLGGVPTRRKVTTQDAQDTLVGTRFYGAAAGWEFSYNFLHKQPKRACIGIIQNRFLHFFNRSWAPLLPCDAKIQPGNVTDILFTLHYRERASIFEIGYNPTIFTNQAVLLKTGPVKSDTFVRQGMFANVSHMWRCVPVLNMPFLLGTGVNISRAKRYDTKIFSCWLNFTTLF